MTRVLLVTGLVGGGVGRHVQQLTGELVHRGHDVRVACPPEVATRLHLADAGADVVPVHIGAAPAPHRDRGTVTDLARAMAGVDVVHAHGVRAGALAALARGRGEDRPALVVTLHNAAPGGRLRAALHAGLERVVARQADLVLGVSADLVARARVLGAPQVDRAVVPAARARPGRSAEDVRTELGVGDRPLVVSVGRLAPQKGFDRLLETMATQDLGGTLLLVGEGPQRPALSRQVERLRLPVLLLGHREDVPDLLGAADVAVSAARWEGQPVWLQEALSVGLPVVATDVGGTRDVLDGAGVLVPGEDMDALVATVCRLLGDPEARAEQARLSRARSDRLPTAGEAADAALTAYQRACGSRRTR